MLALFPRVLDLGVILSPDEPQWYRNTVGFTEGLEAADASQLYQQPHPGITTTWLASITVDSDSWAARRAPLAVAVALLIAGATGLMIRLWGRAVGLAAGVLLAVNPIFIAHSRVLAMDALLSIFLLLSLLGLLGWFERREHRWLVFSGVAGALSVLSKMVGVLVLPFFIGLLIVLVIARRVAVATAARAAVVWAMAFVVGLVVFLPTLVVEPWRVIEGTKEFFATEHYSQAVHALGPWWYPQALLLWTTPLHIMGALALPFVWAAPSRIRRHVGILGIFAVLFFLALQYSIKKGDRYLLPDFLLFDVIALLLVVYGAAGVLRRVFSKHVYSLAARGLLVIVGLAVAWQIVEVVRLHPYALAYRNPLFRQLAAGRAMGWGEGLDLAAEYLNAKPNAQKLLVISYYESSFAYRFGGQVTSAERLVQETPQEIGADYVILYRTMEGRAPDRWETKVRQQFADANPEYVVIINGEEYVWIYRITGE